jgi:hypothetical protein
MGLIHPEVHWLYGQIDRPSCLAQDTDFHFWVVFDVVTLIRTDGAVVTSTAVVTLSPTQTTQTVTFDFGIANTAIQSGSPVSQSYSDSYYNNGYQNLPTFMYSPVQSIFTSTETATYYDSTSTIETSEMNSSLANFQRSLLTKHMKQPRAQWVLCRLRASHKVPQPPHALQARQS